MKSISRAVYLSQGAADRPAWWVRSVGGSTDRLLFLLLAGAGEGEQVVQQADVEERDDRLARAPVVPGDVLVLARARPLGGAGAGQDGDDAPAADLPGDHQRVAVQHLVAQPLQAPFRAGGVLLLPQ